MCGKREGERGRVSWQEGSMYELCIIIRITAFNHYFRRPERNETFQAYRVHLTYGENEILRYRDNFKRWNNVIHLKWSFSAKWIMTCAAYYGHSSLTMQMLSETTTCSSSICIHALPFHFVSTFGSKLLWHLDCCSVVCYFLKIFVRVFVFVYIFCP